MKATVTSSGGVGSRVRLGDHDVVFDQPLDVPGGQDRGPSPLDVMGASVAACAHYYAAAFLYARGLTTEGLAVEVETEKQRSPAPRLSRLSMTIHLPNGLTARQIEGIERAIKSCPAYGTLLHPPTVDVLLAAEPSPASAAASR